MCSKATPEDRGGTYYVDVFYDVELDEYVKHPVVVEGAFEGLTFNIGRDEAGDFWLNATDEGSGEECPRGPLSFADVCAALVKFREEALG